MGKAKPPAPAPDSAAVLAQLRLELGAATGRVKDLETKVGEAEAAAVVRHVDVLLLFADHTCGAVSDAAVADRIASSTTCVRCQLLDVKTCSYCDPRYRFAVVTPE